MIAEQLARAPGSPGSSARPGTRPPSGMPVSSKTSAGRGPAVVVTALDRRSKPPGSAARSRSRRTRRGPRSKATSRSDQSRGIPSTTLKAPTHVALAGHRAAPRHTRSNRARERRGCFGAAGCRRVSSTTSGSPDTATWRQKEWLSGELATAGPGLGQPGGALEELPVVVDEGDRETGAPSSRAAIRVSRSKASSGGVSSSAVRVTAACRSRSVGGGRPRGLSKSLGDK